MSLKNKFKNVLIKENKILSIFLIIILILFPIILIFNLSFLFPKQTNGAKVSQVLNSVKNEEEKHEAWPINPTSKIEFKTLVEQYTPESSNLQELFDWARSYNVDPNTPLPSSIFYDNFKAKSSLNPAFTWDDVGFATTGQFREFLCYYGKEFTDEEGNKHKGLENFTSATFISTDIDFGLPEFWLSLHEYMPNVKTIKIKANYISHRSMTKIPKEMGCHDFISITIDNENIEDNYENFLYANSPLSQSLTHLVITNSTLKDHTVKKDDKDSIYYFTEVAFANFGNSPLQYIDLSKNQLTHIKGNLLCLPNVIELRLQNNQIAHWHCVDANGKEGYDVKTEGGETIFVPISGQGQRCFPNPNSISYINLANNNLYELVHLSPSEWTPTIIEQYRRTQVDLYPALNFLDVSGQKVEENLFIFGNNENYLGSSVSDMNLDLSNIYRFPVNIESSDKVDYISKCLLDRQTNHGEYGKVDQWDHLTLTENVMPSIVDLFKDFNHYVTRYESINLPNFHLNEDDVSVWGVSTGGSEWKHKTNYYTSVSSNYPDEEKAEVRHSEEEEPFDSTFFSTETGNIYSPTDNHKRGANALRLHNKDVSIDTYTTTGGPCATGVSQTYEETKYTIKIDPSFNVDVGPVKGLKKSTFTYNVQIFNAENFVFYLTGKEDKKDGQTVWSDYLKSITDKDIKVEEAYEHFWDLVTPVGSSLKKEWFDYNFNNREFWQINFVINNKVDRIMTLNLTYPVYQYIGSNSETVLPTKLTMNLKIKMYPTPENKLQFILTIILCCEIGLFVLLLIPLIYFLIRTRIKSNNIKEEKTKNILAAEENKNKPKMDITEHETKEEKIPFKERFDNIVNKGDHAKTKKVKVESKSTTEGKEAIDFDEILKELE